MRARAGRLAPVDERVRGQPLLVVAADELGRTATVHHGFVELEVERPGMVRQQRCASFGWDGRRADPIWASKLSE